jgi:muramoyltetrapeptide carboxypeptidase
MLITPSLSHGGAGREARPQRDEQGCAGQPERPAAQPQRRAADGEQPAGQRGRVFDDWVGDPTLSTLDLDGTGDWSLLDPATGPVDVTGRLVGGCLEVLGPICSTYADVAAFGRDHADEGLVVYVEQSDEEAITACRMLHAMRYAGWFDHATAVLVGRTLAPGSDGMTQHDAVRDALGDLDVPVVLDVECGHVAPFLPLVNGARARVVMDDERREITQELGR